MAMSDGKSLDPFWRFCTGPGCACEDYGDIAHERRAIRAHGGLPLWVRTNRDEIAGLGGLEPPAPEPRTGRGLLV